MKVRQESGTVKTVRTPKKSKIKALNLNPETIMNYNNSRLRSIAQIKNPSLTTVMIVHFMTGFMRVLRKLLCRTVILLKTRIYWGLNSV